VYLKFVVFTFIYFFSQSSFIMKSIRDVTTESAKANLVMAIQC
jgi:hypothetical protein